MKCLSIQNPWSYLIAYGVKDVENRSQNVNFRGRFLVHSCGKPWIWPNLSTLPKGFQSRCDDAYDNNVPYDALPVDLRRYTDLQNHCQNFLGVHGDADLKAMAQKMCLAAEKKGHPMVSHAIIGSVDLVDVVRDSKSCWSNPYCFHLILENPKIFEKPILNVKGKLGWWNFDLPDNMEE